MDIGAIINKFQYTLKLEELANLTTKKSKTIFIREIKGSPYNTTNS